MNFKFDNHEDVVKLALAVYIKMGRMGKDKKTQFNVDIFRIIDDPNVFTHYNWSSVIFK